MNRNEVVVNHQLISFISADKAGDKCLLFLHGWRSQKEVWDHVARSMYYVASIYSIDLPGFGASPAPLEAWSVGNYAELVKGFIEKLELKNVILVGHSFGGRVAIKLAALYPKIVDKLVLIDSAGFAIESNKKNLMGLAAKIVKPFFKPKFMKPLRNKIYKAIGAEDYLATPELQKTFVNITSEDLTEDMSRINIPTLIVWGENDKETPIEFGQKMHSLIRNSKFIILPNAGHFSFLDKPEEFVKILMDFLTKYA